MNLFSWNGISRGEWVIASLRVASEFMSAEEAVRNTKRRDAKKAALSLVFAISKSFREV